MSVAQKIQDLLLNTKQDKSVEKFQEQYSDLLSQGVIQRKGYNLAGLDVIGDNDPLPQSSSMTLLAATFNK